MDIPDLAAANLEVAESALAALRTRNVQRMQGEMALRLIEGSSPQVARPMPEGATFSTYA